jgi:hypothetical protein
MSEVLETDLKQRAYDGKWELIGKIKDVDNSYSYKTDGGTTVTLTSEKWVTIGVYDYLLNIEEWMQ